MKLIKFFEQHYIPLKQLTHFKTQRDYRTVIKFLSEHLGRPAKVKDLKEEVVSAFLISQDGIKQATTINAYRAKLVALATLAVKQKRLKKRFEVDKRKELKRIPRGWTMEEFNKILYHASQAKDWCHWVPLLLTLYDTGSRITAAMSIKREDFDRETGLVILRAETQKHGADQIQKVSDQTRDEINQVWCDDPMLFPWDYDKRKDKTWATLRGRFKLILKAAGLPYGPKDLFHKFRKTTASLLTASVGELEASRQLGHSSVKLTRASYLDPTLTGQSNLADRLPRPKIDGVV